MQSRGFAIRTKKDSCRPSTQYAPTASDGCFKPAKRVRSQPKDERQIGPEIDVLVSTHAVKFNFEQRGRSYSSY